MNHIMNTKKQHPYSSALRQEQARRTREQILEGLVRAIAQGSIDELSIPIVAREAGVSVPTVYRHFRTKHDLLASLAGYIAQKVGLNPALLLPKSPKELEATVQELYIKYLNAGEMLHALSATELTQEIRREGHERRLELLNQALEPVKGQFDETDMNHLRNIIFLFTTTAAMRAFKDYLNLSGEEAATSVNWAIRRLTGFTTSQTSPPNHPEHLNKDTANPQEVDSNKTKS